MWSSDKNFSQSSSFFTLSHVCTIHLIFFSLSVWIYVKDEKKKKFLCDEETKWGGKWTEEEVINNFMPVTCDNFSLSLHNTISILKNVFWNVLNVFLIFQLFVNLKFKGIFNFLFGAGGDLENYGRNLFIFNY